MRTILRGLLSLFCGLIVGCSNGNTRVQVMSRRPPPAWRGSFVLAPEEIEKQEIKAYSQIVFLGGKAQVMGFDRETPGWGWSAAVTVAPTQGESFQMKCESLLVFSTQGKTRVVFNQDRGKAGVYLSRDEADQKGADKLMKDSARLDAVVPKSLRECADNAVAFHPEVLPGGVVTLVSEEGSFRFLPHDAEAFRDMVKRIPEPTGNLEPWKTTSGFSRVENGLYASRSNLYLPLAQTHRFYRLRLWSVEDLGDCGLGLKGVAGARPSPQVATNGWGTNGFLYNQIERGEWLEPQLSSARLIVSENGVDRAPETLELAADGGIYLETVPATARLEMIYSISDRADRELVQELRLGANRQLIPGAVQLRQKEEALKIASPSSL